MKEILRSRELFIQLVSLAIMNFVDFYLAWCWNNVPAVFFISLKPLWGVQARPFRVQTEKQPPHTEKAGSLILDMMCDKWRLQLGADEERKESGYNSKRV